MAGINPAMERSAGRRIGSAAVSAPRLVMSWEDWLTFVAAIVTFLSVAVSIQQADWVRPDRMPPLVPTALAGLLIGMLAARLRMPAAVIHPVALTIGLVVVVLAAQSFADGDTLSQRLADFRLRMDEWWTVVRAGDISNDNLPFVALVHALCFLATYIACWAIYRWHNAWIAVVPGGVILLANISFLSGQPSGAFIFFLFGAIVLIARMHLQKSQVQWRKQGVEYPELISASAIQLTLVLATGLLIGAWLVPIGAQAQAVEGAFDAIAKPVSGQTETFIRLFHNVDSRKGAKLHSFGETLPIQGNVKLGTKSVFEVSSPQPGLIRATSYDEYTGNGWKATGRDSERIDAQTLAVPEDTQTYAKRVFSILRVKVLDPESTLLTSGTPLSSNVATTVDRPEGFDGDVERMRSRKGLGKDDTYNTVGSISTATDLDLMGAGAEYPDWVSERYLQLPDSLPDRVRDETARILAEAGAANSSAYEKAVAVEAYMRTFPYDLAVESAPPGRDTVDFLLFDLKRGYFDYQATAMAVMLRAQGIPARPAVGYVLDAGSGAETVYIVKKDNAYSWVEVFFPGYGWITFNPTGDRAEGGVGGLNDPGLNDPGPFVDPGNLEELIGEPDDPTPSGPVQEVLNEDPITNDAPPWTLIWSLAGALTVIAALALVGRISWNWGLGGLEGRVQMWAKTQRLARWAGLGSRPHETPLEWSRRMGGAIEREKEAVGLASAYEESRYGRPDQRRIGEEQTQGAYEGLRRALVSTVFRRKRKR